MIYLDNNATTRLDEEVFQTMAPYFIHQYGNASSLQHKLGRQANQAVEDVRSKIANHLHALPKEIFFNSGSTEAINTVIKGVYERYKSIGSHIITCQTEHKAVLETCEAIRKKGANITYLPVDANGNINLQELASSITKETILVCLMSANNETGVMHPVTEIANLCQSKNVLFFCDATQSVGKSPIDLSLSPIDILCLSAHKFHGPKGIGALFVRRKSKPIQIEPLLVGGKQEQSFRAGTLNVPAIVGMGKAIDQIDFNTYLEIENLKLYFERKIEELIPEIIIIAQKGNRNSNTSNIYFKHVQSNELLAKLKSVAAASGSACVSGDRAPSHVLKAMHLTDEQALSCVRFSFSKYNTPTEVDDAVIEISQSVEKIRMQSPIWQMYKAGLLD